MVALWFAGRRQAHKTTVQRAFILTAVEFDCSFLDVCVHVVTDDLLEDNVIGAAQFDGLFTRHVRADVDFGHGGAAVRSAALFDLAERDLFFRGDFDRGFVDHLERVAAAWHLHDAVVADSRAIDLGDHMDDASHVVVEGRTWVVDIHWEWHLVVLAFQRLGEDSGVRVRDAVGPPWAPNNGTQAAHASIDKALARVVTEQEFVACLLDAVRALRIVAPPRARMQIRSGEYSTRCKTQPAGVRCIMM